MKHLLKMQDLTKEQIAELLDLADQLKYEQKNGIAHPKLQGKALGMIFEKASTRTRVSFEVGMAQLGGQALFLSASDMQLGRGEPIKDTARVLSRYLDGIMIRTFAQKTVDEFAEYGSIPIINGLTDYAHPCQILADLMTIREQKGKLEGLTLCYIGDGNNMANSLIVGALTMGMKVRCATPETHMPDQKVLEFAKGKDYFYSSNPLEASKGTDVVVTDVWASMGQEAEAESRKQLFASFQVNEEIMNQANAGAIVLHCLPAHRGEEISEETFEKHATVIFDEAENRLHAQKAVLVKLMSK